MTTHPVLMASAAALLLSACAAPPGRTALPADHPAQVALDAHRALTAEHAPAAQAPTATPPAASDTEPARPLSADDAVRLALRRSPALTALVAQSEAQAAEARAQARPGLLSLSLTRLRRGEASELERSLGIGLMDLFTWPWRSAAADRQIAAGQQALAVQVLGHVQAVRQQWVRAVAAQQRQAYQGDVLTAAKTSAELARRMQAAGHFSHAQAAQQAVGEVEAQLAHNQARQAAQRERESLVRLIGLQGEEARALQLPDRLPTLPTQPAWTPDSLAEAARARRLDTRLAEARWQASRSDGESGALRSLVDIEGELQRNQASGEPAQRGAGLQIRLASIDFGAARRQASRETERAALARWQQTTLVAESTLRERWSDYLATLDTARQATEGLQPLRQRLLGERLKQYNGMLIGPFELLAEARAHTGAVLTALDAQREFWLADAALNAAIDGLDTTPAALQATPASGNTAEAGH
ncbi:TolC family protein [Aquabacterium sp.]|uniref:TolC family protein n=1 Tax=Aquabacterium sp. TaxID=1872578 RepID=UPI0025B9724B|nr:TolC family protein [Aquabacterium sp.]